jgi:F-type H+-transporting ATPase subunit epsilon
MELKVLTPKGVALKCAVESVVAPGGVGYLGVLRNHAPLITTIQPGILRWRTASGETDQLQVGSGLMEVVHNQVTLLVSEAATQPEDGQSS